MLPILVSGLFLLVLIVTSPPLHPDVYRDKIVLVVIHGALTGLIALWLIAEIRWWATTAPKVVSPTPVAPKPRFAVWINGKPSKWESFDLTPGVPDPEKEYLQFKDWVETRRPALAVSPGDRIRIFDTKTGSLLYDVYAYGVHKYAVTIDDDPTVQHVTVEPGVSLRQVATLAGARMGERVSVMNVGHGEWRNFTLSN